MPDAHSRSPRRWWSFIDYDAAAPATGTFRAVGPERIGRLYVPLVNEAGMFSWTSSRLQGGPAAGHHEYLAPPLTAEELPHTLVHRDVWLLEPGREPFSLSDLSPSGLRPHTEERPRPHAASIEAGPGWFRLIRHGPGGRFAIRATLWCPADLDDRVEVMWVDVTNTSRTPLRISAYAAIPLFARSADNVRDHRHVTALLHRIVRLPHGITVCPTMSFDERGHRINRTRYSVLAFGPERAAPAGIWSTEEAFLGEGGTFAAPAAVWKRHPAPQQPWRQAPGQEALGGFRFRERLLAPGRSTSYVLLCGISEGAEATTRWSRWAKRPGAIARSLAKTQAYWLAQIGGIRYVTAERELDQWLMWVGFQPHLRRLYGNSFLPQFDYGRGGRGWRDLWQDSLARLLSEPAAVRATILYNLGGVRIDGSNATIIGKDGTFIADRNNIPRTWMDHGVWPTYTTLLYLDQTGDVNVLFARREYFRDPQLFRCQRQDPRWSERYGRALRTRRGALYRGSVLEHLLVQNLTAFFNVGEHNVCRLEGADWNDGLDMARTRGESVAFSAFYAWNLQRLARLLAILRSRGVRRIELAEELARLLDRLPGQRRVDYRSPAAKRARLAQYLEAVSHDVSGRRLALPLEGVIEDLLAKHRDLAERIRRREWITTRRGAFFNGYYDERGRRVEGAHPRGVRMTLTGQTFAVMSGIATEAQVDEIVRSVDRLLREASSGGVRLNTDFGAIQPDLGRAFSFAYGEKENGAVFSHMAVMYAYALYARRRAKEGRRVWRALYRMATHQERAKIFPCLPEYFNRQGRGMYGYLTGSASWLIALLLTQVYGIRGELGDLVIDPQFTPEDFGSRPELAVDCRFAGRRLRVVFVNPHRVLPDATDVEAVLGPRGPMALTRQAAAGVRLGRAAIRALDPKRPTLLRVILGRR